MNILKYAKLFEAAAQFFGADKFAELATEPAKKQFVVRNLLIPDPRRTPDAYCSDAARLRSEFQVVVFDFRAREFEDMLAWCNAEAPFAWRLIHGDSGRGKTRLMVEMCAHLNGEATGNDWNAGFLAVERFQEDPDAYEILFESPKPLFVVVDYAERQSAIVTELLKRSRRRGAVDAAKITRIALVARRRSEVWERIFRDDPELHELRRDLLEDFRLAPVTQEHDVAAVFAGAFGYFARHFGKDHAAPPLDFGRLTHGNGAPDIGLVHMLALLAAVAPAEFGAGKNFRPTEDDVLGFLLARERRHWSRAAVAHGLPPELRSDAVLGEAAALLTLASQQGAIATAADARAVLRAATSLGDQPAALLDRIAEIFRETYPETGHVGGVAPDLLGDYLTLGAVLMLDPARILADPAAGGFTEAQALSALTRLNWIAQRWPEKGRAAIRAALGANPVRVLPLVVEVAVESGDPVGRIAAEWLQAAGDPALAASIEAMLPQQTTALRELAAVALAATVAVAADEAERARGLNNFANRLSALGRREEALSAAEEAVDLRRRLAQARPDAFVPDLATSLNNLAAMLSALGRREEALSAAAEAVSLRRGLAETRPDAFVSDLAGSLNNLANWLSALGRREDALSAAEEAVGLYRGLAQARPDAFVPDLATSFNNLAIRLSELGRREEALSAAEEAVGLYRGLAQARPDAFVPDLATSLNNLANRLSELGRREEALSAAEEAVGLRRGLAQARPAVFAGDLARSLAVLTIVLDGLGRADEAAAARAEAIALDPRWAEILPRPPGDV